MKRKWTALLLSSFFLLSITKGQNNIDSIQRPFSPVKFGLTAGGGALFYAGTLTGLYTIWYQENNWVGFHFKNDNAGWMQIDKYGHAYTCYMMGKLGMQALKWSGVSRKKSILYGGSFGFLFMTSIEILDGHYAEWGASPMDMVSNASGSLMLIAQELAFKKQILTYKFSYHHTELANYKPGVLGETDLARVVADYNGQSFWLSLNLKSVLPKQQFLPNWLNVAGGYGAYGMLAGEVNPLYADDGSSVAHVKRYRRYFLSLDVDLDKIKTNSRLLKSAFFFLNLIKFPMPTLEFNELGQTKFHPIFF